MLSTKSERTGLKYEKGLYCSVNSTIIQLLYKLIGRIVALLCKYNFQQQSAAYQQRYSNKVGPPYQFCLVFSISPKCFILEVSIGNQSPQLYFFDKAIFRNKFTFFKTRTKRIREKELPTKIRQCPPPFHGVKKLQ